MENFGIIVILGGIFFGLVLHTRSKRKAFDEKLSSAMQEHSRALVSYYQQTRQTDQFGNVDLSKWIKKIDVFLRTQVATNMDDFSGWRRSKQGNASANIVHSFTINQIHA